MSTAYTTLGNVELPEEPKGITSDDDNYPVPGGDKVPTPKKPTKTAKPKKAFVPKTVKTKQGGTKTSKTETLVRDGKSLANCSVCGRELSKSTSVDQGMGGVCAHKLGLLPKGVSMQEHIDMNTAPKIPPRYIKTIDAYKAVMAMEPKIVSGHRFVQAFGGNGLLREPFNQYFKTVFVNGVRYTNGACLNHLKDLVKV